MLTVLAGLSALIYWPMARRAPSVPRSVVKTAAVGLLALAAWQQAAPTLLILALVFGSLGDLALSRPGQRPFLLGLISFACGHLALVGLILSRPDSDPSRLVSDHVWLMLALINLAALMAAALIPHAGKLHGPVAVYILIIFMLGLSALTLPMGWVALAAAGFIASDAILGWEVFRLAPDAPARTVTSALIWPLYWGAQLGFLLTLV